ncbi:hypothetical protein HAHE_19170 [Haloferula helveola]|uniref:Uncharacterized protein n=2 Tax=Haloferula helveola TaxID=490095 RepID=A0ABM7RK58_9BACT|nr:hypothetical protein HAHE_19170 [Haloferula helveola]
MNGIHAAPELVAQSLHDDLFRRFRIAARMHQHAGRFVDGDEELVLVKDGQGRVDVRALPEFPKLPIPEPLIELYELLRVI